MTQNPFVIAFAGMLSLAVAMGIGRFAFTPLLPMMLHDGVIGLSQASWLATANYLGYWLGAMGCALQPWVWARWLGRGLPLTAPMRAGLAATVVLTLAMAMPWPTAWPWMRFLAGVASALVFVYTSGWCLVRLSALGAPRLGGLIFVGPGLGIAISGLSATALVAGQQAAATGWAMFGGVALLLVWVVWPRLQGSESSAAPAHTAPEPVHWRSMAVLVVAYGLAGFGYIITATFLPVIARQVLPGSIWLDLFWPLFGLAVAIGAVLTLRVPPHWDRRHLLMACYAVQAAGVVVSLWWPTLAGFALGSLWLGLPFTAITLFAMQEVRRVRPHDAPVFIALLTAAYGLGQIAGPALVAALLARSASPQAGFSVSLQLAAAALLAGLALYGWLARRQPAGGQPR
ncbi:MAG: MFS transporter [Polaromonas sp.]|nr:MFS transporter [Polaromonas sp.]